MPPKKQKQSPRNAFYYFMLDFKGKQGRKYNSLKDVADAAGPIWSRLSKEQRRPYEEQALMEKNHLKLGKYTSEGLDVEELERQDKMEQDRTHAMKEEINNIIKLADRTGRLKEEKFFVIHVNTFCIVANRYYVAEIAISVFSLEMGVLDDGVFHRLVKPGVLPLGYASEATLHSKETHQIQPPLADDIDCNTDVVFEDMKAFLSSHMTGSKRMPILYADEKFQKMIQEVLDTFCMDYHDQNYFKVYNLQYMFRILRNTVANENIFPSDSYSCRELEKDVYAYAKGICCEYHEHTNVPLFCCRSVVVRYAYVICDNCCTDLDIMLVPGCHIPENAMAPGSRPSSVASFRTVSSRSSRSSKGLKPSIRDDDSDSVMSFSSKSEWELESVASETSSMTLNDDEDFPSLTGKSKKEHVFTANSWNRFTPNDSSSVYSQSSSRSYAGATGKSGLSSRPADMPSYSQSSSTEKLSQNSAKSVASEYSFTGRGRANAFENGANDFPVLGRGRPPPVSRGRGFRRPNNGE